jgi:4-diphosphocytidyl-2-C-methyl-D-erythritol kinase
MLVFPNCKINLGLQVISKRDDGFHNIESCFYPVNWCDALEVINYNGSEGAFKFSQTGIKIEGNIKNNLVYKAWEILSNKKQLPPLLVHLHKNVPMGAGLGGGSSDGASLINVINEKFNLDFSVEEKRVTASQLGSDCAFFIENKPVLASGKGDQFSNLKVDLSKYFLLVVHPPIHSNTKEAYEGLILRKPTHSLREVVEQAPVNEWKNLLVNDFEDSVFKKHPAIKSLKETFYSAGAVYASMSGSGSSVYGLFEKEPEMNFPNDYTFYLQKPSSKIL